jgi:hypothetical protein
VANIVEVDHPLRAKVTVSHGHDKMPDFNIANLTDQPFNVGINALIERTSMPELPRPYLGASAIGDDCARRIQYDWWCKPELAARVRRIFERGHFFEFRTREQLIEAGFKFSTNRADLEFTAFDGNFRGHADGLILAGPDLPDAHLAYPCLWECKALNGKNWRAVAKNGLIKTFPKYAAQVSVYQRHLNRINPVLFTAANADTCELLHFVVPFNAQAAQYWADRAAMIIAATRAGELLPRVANDRDNFHCKICPHKGRCWR